MRKAVTIGKLIERTNDSGAVVLSGWLDERKVIATRGRPTNAGHTTWHLVELQPDERANEQRRGGYHRRNAGREGRSASLRPSAPGPLRTPSVHAPRPGLIRARQPKENDID